MSETGTSSPELPLPGDEILYRVQDRIATITLNRPERLNACTETMQQALYSAFEMANEDDDVRAVVVTGSGRGFCAGADIGNGNAFESLTPPTTETLARTGGGRITLKIFSMLKPVIAAFNGPAVGFGVTMTLPMDIRLASESARFGFPFVQRGIVPDAASGWFLPRVVGIDRALDWCLTGRLIDADEARSAGLVRSIHADGDLLPAAYELAQAIVSSAGPVAVAMSRQLLWRMLGESHPRAAQRIDALALYHLGKSADVAEGMRAFQEKRVPEFSSRISADMPDFFPWWDDHKNETAGTSHDQ